MCILLYVFFLVVWVDKHIQIHKYKSRNYCESLKSICVCFVFHFLLQLWYFFHSCMWVVYVCVYVCIELMNQKPFSSPFCIHSFYFWLAHSFCKFICKHAKSFISNRLHRRKQTRNGSKSENKNEMRPREVEWTSQREKEE